MSSDNYPLYAELITSGTPYPLETTMYLTSLNAILEKIPVAIDSGQPAVNDTIDCVEPAVIVEVESVDEVLDTSMDPIVITEVDCS